MKMIYLFLIAMFSLSLIAQPHPEEQPVTVTQQPITIIDVQPNIFHLGKIPDTEIQHFAFTLTNNSQEMMKIERVSVSCGCTVFDQNFEEVLPGKSTQLKVAFDPKGRRGYARWEILIYTNVKSMPIAMAPFDVEIFKDAMISHDAVLFGEFLRGTAVEQEIWLAPKDAPNFQIKKIDLLLADIEEPCFDIVYKDGIYDGFFPGSRRAYSIKIVAKSDIPYGRLEGKLRISTDIPGKETIELPFLAKVGGVIGVRPDYIPMGTFYSGDHVMRRIMIFHREGKSFQIEKMESDVPFLSMGFIPVLEDQYYQVMVSIKKDASIPTGEFRGKIVVFTSSEEMPKIILPLQGIVLERK